MIYFYYFSIFYYLDYFLGNPLYKLFFLLVFNIFLGPMSPRVFAYFVEKFLRLCETTRLRVLAYLY